MAIFIREQLRQANDNTFLSLQIGCYRERLRINDYQTWQMASRAFKPDTPKTLEVGFDRIKGSKPWIAGTMEIPSCTDDEAGSATAGNARTRGVNPSMAGRVCPFPEFDDPESVSDSMISLMTTEEVGAEVTLPKHFCRYSSQSFLDPTDSIETSS